MKSELLTILSERGFIRQATNLEGLDDLLAEHSPTAIYIGFDLTAPSLHVGSLIQLMVLRWIDKTGHTPVVLYGDATTQVGDPTGKDKQRPLLDVDAICFNGRGISRAINQVVPRFEVASNFDWFHRTEFLAFMREYGPHFSVNRMLTLESVKSRLERSEPMTMLELIYPMMQAVDFLELFRRNTGISDGAIREVKVQVGGSDQWGNIINGVELVRRVQGEEVFGLTTPLMTNSAGEKMGKTAKGAVWLDAKKTSVFDFWQFWRNVEDAKVVEFLKLFTELPLDEIEKLAQHKGAAINEVKKVLATEVTSIVHGRVAALDAQERAEKMFEQGDLDVAPDLHRIDWNLDRTIADILVRAKMVKSKGEADRLAAQGGIRVEGIVLGDVRGELDQIEEREFTVSVGKKRTIRIVYGETA